MNLLSRWAHRLRTFVHSDTTERDMDAEMRLHLELEARDLQARGMSVHEARRHAAISFGGVERFKDEAREQRPLHVIENLTRDIRHAVRQLNRKRTLTVSAALLLALGIGGTVTVFSVLNTIYFRPLPYPHAGRLVTVQVAMTGVQCGDRCARDPDYDEAQAFASSASIEKLGTIRVTQGTMYFSGRAAILEGGAVSESLSDILGFKAALGRTFTAGDFAADAPAVLLLSRSSWMTEFGGDSGVVGRTYTLGETPHTVVGVLHAAAELGSPLYAFNSGGSAQYFVADRGALTPAGSQTRVIARLRDSSSVDRLRTELTVQLEQRAKSGDAPATAAGQASVELLRDTLSKTYRSSFWILFGAVGAVLLITCLNVTGLFLARLTDRAPELATRTALGASRFRLAQQIGTETIVIAVAGGVGGVLVAKLGIIATGVLPAGQLPFWSNVALDINSLALAAMLTVGAALILSIAPVFVLSPNRLMTGLRGAAGVTRPRARIRNVLVTAQVALSVVLLGSAGMLTKVLLDAELRDIGTSKHDMLYVMLETPPFVSDEAALTLQQRIVQRLQAVPDVTAVAVEGTAPRASRARQAAGGIRQRTDAPRAQTRPSGTRPPALSVEGVAEALPASIAPSSASDVSPDYFLAKGHRTLRGRTFNANDILGTAPVAIIDEPTARRLFGGEEAVGKRVKFGALSSENPWMTIVGVVSGTVNNALSRDETYRPQLYRSILQYPASPSTVYVKFNANSRYQLNAVRAAIGEADASLPIAKILSVEQSIGLRLWPARFNAFVLGTFALFAVLLSCLGIYAAVAFTISSQQRETAVRVALGAPRNEIVLNLMNTATRTVFVGLAFGLGGALLATRALRSMLYGASGLNAAVFLAVALAMIATSLFAAFLPARRAARVDPARLLRLQ